MKQHNGTSESVSRRSKRKSYLLVTLLLSGLVAASFPIIAQPAYATQTYVLITAPQTGFIISTLAGPYVQGSGYPILTNVDDLNRPAHEDFYVNGVFKKSVNYPTIGFYWDILNYPNGQYTVQARAYDNAGNYGSSSVTVTLSNPDIAPPQITVLQPSAGQTISGSYIVKVQVVDPTLQSSGIQRVEFHIGGVGTLGTDFAPTVLPSEYDFTWNTNSYPNGNYNFWIVAYDNKGNVAYTPNIGVTISNSAGDTIAPTASITSPSNGATVSGTVSVSLSSSDNIGVTKTELYIDGSLVASSTASSLSYGWNTLSYANGGHSVVAKGYDAANNVGTSSTVIVTVNNPITDTTAPTASITSPATGTYVSGTVTVSASASDNVGVTKVELYIDGTLYLTDTLSPYSFSWNTASYAAGSHSLVAKAYDAANKIGTSSSITVTVYNGMTLTYTTAQSGNSLTIAASATAPSGIQRVEFWIDGKLKATDSSAPYSYDWNLKPVKDGTYTITIKAFDNLGTMAQVTFTVSIKNHIVV